MKNFIIIMICVFAFSCSSTSTFETKSFKVVSIEEFESCYRIKSLDQNLKDTVNLISLKYQMLRKDREVPKFNATSQIVTQNNYNFKLQKVRTRVSSMEQLGKWIIFGKDTLWKGNSKEVEPKYFYALNTLGLEISE